MNQYSNEGYLMSAMQLLMSATLVLLNQRAMKRKTVSNGKQTPDEKLR